MYRSSINDLYSLLCYEAIRQDNKVPDCKQEARVIFSVKKFARHNMPDHFTVNFGKVRDLFYSSYTNIHSIN